MKRSSYRVLIVITLAAFAFALVRPGFVLRTISFFTPTETPAAEEALQEATERAAANATVDVAGIDFDVQPLSDEEEATAEETPAAPQTNDSEIIDDVAPVYGENQLIIPRMGVNAAVFEGETQEGLRKGLWHIPGSALPGSNGNIVISAHRWLYRPPNPKTFYLIDKLEVGDPIYYDYQGVRYTYVVTKTFIVNPEDVHILSQDENKLTLFTCTPLFSTANRYVVNAELVSVDNSQV